MRDPYETMGLSQSSDEAAIRSQYLKLVREFPPDRNPDRFAEIRAAYDDLRNPVGRLRSQLFRVESQDSIPELVAELHSRLGDAKIPMEALLRLADTP